MSETIERGYMLGENNLGLDLMRATEAAALAAARWRGRGQKEEGDGAAVDAMRAVLAGVRMDGTIIIGEGEKDEAPMLHNGEKVGTGEGPGIDIAVDPVDGTRLLALGMRNSIAVLAAAEAGTMYNPTMCFYMDKLAVGPDAADVIDIEAPIAENIKRVAKAKGKDVGDIVVAMLNRERHEGLAQAIRDAGARTRMYTDGDVAASVSAASEAVTSVDLLAGIGGSPEGVVSACAMKAMGGRIMAKLHPTSDEERQKTIDAGFDVDKVLDTNDLVSSDKTIFVATGISDGDLVDGVQYLDHGGARTHSVVMRSASGTTRYIEAFHHLDKLNAYAKASGQKLREL
ncbi:class II fructose-bisphosphatase [Enemella sp. A6]|uniref:class II fructose-bisphosphatase n=1 Tax=Enemella sp. A6 TaxID=3440152 RepID=UPI003EBFFDEC